MSNEIMKKLEEHDKHFERMNKKFEEHDKHFERMNKKFEEHDKHFERMNKKFEEHDKHFEDILGAINDFAFNVEERFNKIENDVKVIKSTMVTKDYLDEKLGDLRGDLTVLIRKEDNKVKELVNVLVKKKVLSEKDQEKLFKMEPFAQVSI